MRRYSDAQILRLGAITVALMLLISAASFNLGKFPGFRGTSYTAIFADASGIHRGNMVQVGGIRVGRVQGIELDQNKVIVKFEVDAGVKFGKDSTASVEVLNLLGEKYLNITPVGTGQLAADTPIPLDRTQAAYDIIGVFTDLTTTTEAIDKEQLKQALDVVSGTIDSAAPEIQRSFDGISRLSRAVSSRDAEIKSLLASSKRVTRVLDARGQDLVDLMENADLVFQEVRKRKQAIHVLLVNARSLAIELKGVADDNKDQIRPALAEVNDLLQLLIDKEKEVKATLAAFGPYVGILGNIIGTGPWFDAYLSNLLAIPSPEFVPGFVEDGS